MKKYCEKCGRYEEIIVTEENRDFNVKGKTINATIKISKCSICGEEIWNKEAEIDNEVVVFGLYRGIEGLLLPEDIVQIRSRYGLSQKSFAVLLGFGEKTITRYENGSIQDKAHDNLMRFVSRESNFFALWNLRKDALTVKDNEKIEKALVNMNDYTFAYNPNDSWFNLGYMTCYTGECKYEC